MIEHVTMISRVAVACASLSDGAELSAHEKLKAIDGDDEQTEQRIQGPGLLDCSVSVSSVQPYVRTHARADKTGKKSYGSWLCCAVVIWREEQLNTCRNWTTYRVAVAREIYLISLDSGLVALGKFLYAFGGTRSREAIWLWSSGNVRFVMPCHAKPRKVVCRGAY